MVLGFLFPQTTCFVEEKPGENSAHSANAKILSFKYKRQAATGRHDKRRENHGHVVPLPCVFRVNVMLDRSVTLERLTVSVNLCYFQEAIKKTLLLNLTE